MERKTKVHAGEGKHDLLITREFDLPVELLFKAHIEPHIFEQWMSHEYGTVRVLNFDGKTHGSWQFQTSDMQGNVVFGARGVFHEVIPNRKITRTFEMIGTPLDVQLEFLEFEKLTEDTSRLTMQSIYRTPGLRDELLKNPFAAGLNMAHNRLQNILGKLK